MKDEIINPYGYDIEEVEWFDSTTPGDSGWISIDDLVSEDDEFMLSCFTSGYVLRDTDQDLWIINSYHENAEGGNCTGLIAIPKVAIIKRTLLKKGEQ